MDKIETKDEFQEHPEKRTYDPLPDNSQAAKYRDRIKKQETTIKTSFTERY